VAPEEPQVRQAHPAQRRVLGVLSGSQVLGGTGSVLGVTVAGLAAASASGSDAIGGFAQTAMVLGAATFALPVGRIAERSGRRAALMFGYVAGAGGAVLAAVAIHTGVWPLLLAALIPFGAGTAASLSARFAATDLALPTARAKALSIVVFATAFGAIAGPNLADPVGRIATGAGLAPVAGPFLLAAVALLLGLRPDPLLESRRAGVATETQPVAKARLTGGLAGVRALPYQAKLALAGVALSHTAMVGVMSMTPVHMDHSGMSLRLVGVVISMHVVGMYVASPLWGWLADRAGRLPVLVIGLALLITAAAIGALAGDATTLSASMLIMGIGWSGGLIGGSTLVTESVQPQDRLTAQAATDLVMNLGGVGGGVLAGILISVTSYAVLGLLVGLLALPVLVAAMFSALQALEA
jgi:MFS family permease